MRRSSSLELSFEADFAEFSPTGAFATPALFVGPMIWTDDVTVRQHWKVGDADIEAADLNVGDGTFVPVEPDSVRGWSGECPIRVWGGFVRDEVRGPLALIDETVVSYCR